MIARARARWLRGCPPARLLKLRPEITDLLCQHPVLLLEALYQPNEFHHGLGASLTGCQSASIRLSLTVIQPDKPGRSVGRRYLLRLELAPLHSPPYGD